MRMMIALPGVWRINSTEGGVAASISRGFYVSRLSFDTKREIAESKYGIRPVQAEGTALVRAGYQLVLRQGAGNRRRGQGRLSRRALRHRAAGPRRRCRWKHQ